MKDRQFVTPVLVRDGEATPLRRVPFDERTFDELALQDLLFAHPAVIPVGDIEPLFAGLRPLARELPVGGGFLDLIFMNGEGYLTLVETKLWRNPEARRTVVAQIIDYASNLSTWTYDDLRQAVLSCRNNGTVASSDPLVDLASDGDDDVDEQEFVDRMNRNLRLGRFVLLITHARRCYQRFTEAGRSSTQSRSCGTRIDTTNALQVFPVEIILVDPVDRIPDPGAHADRRRHHQRPARWGSLYRPLHRRGHARDDTPDTGR